MIYQTTPFSMTFNELYPRFKVTPFFDAEYLRTVQGLYVHKAQDGGAVGAEEFGQKFLNLVTSNGTSWCIFGRHYKLKFIVFYALNTSCTDVHNIYKK